MSKTQKKIFAFTLCMVMAATTFAYAAEVPADVKDKSYEKAVQTLMEKGIVTGDTDGSFHPDETLTRAQACIIVVKSMNPSEAEVSATVTQPAPKSSFSDMSGYGWAEGYVSYAVNHNITKGYPDGTFKPGNKVTMNELITMVLRAADYSDDTIGGSWPSNYLNKAAELELLGNMPSPLPELASKWMAAQMDFNALDRIIAANPPADTPPQGTDQDKPDSAPDAGSMIFVSGKFNSEMTTFNGKSISKNVKLYVYGLQKDYSESMTFSNKIADYREETVYKFKDVKTSAYYRLENDRITEIILPSDVGFTGKAYGVINGTVQTVNGSNEKVTGLKTLTAEREVTWLGKKGLTGIPADSQYLKGEIYELVLNNGTVEAIYKASDSGKKGPVFEEITGNTPNYVTVTSRDGNVLYVDGGQIVELKNRMSVYRIDSSDPTVYEDGNSSSIKAGVQIRAYDISDDKEQSADLVVIKY